MKFLLEQIYRNIILSLYGAKPFRHYLVAQNFQVNNRNWVSMKKRTIIILVIIAIVAIPIALYTILPLFTNKVVDEPLPIASGMTLTVFENEKFVEQKG